VGAGAIGRSGKVALYFRDDAPALGPPPSLSAARAREAGPEDEEPLAVAAMLREQLGQGPSFFGELLAVLDAPAELVREALWDLVWAGEATNDAWAPLRAPRLALARERSSTAPGAAHRRRFGARRRSGAQSQVQGRWSLTDSVFAGARGGPEGAVERRRVLAELLLERYGIVTREQVLAEGIKGGFAMLYDTFANLETLGLCRRGYFIEGMGGAQFALPGAVERLRAPVAAPASPAQTETSTLAGGIGCGSAREAPRTLVLAAADPAQPFGAALPWPRREGLERRPARVAGAYVVSVSEEPVLYVERGGRGLVVLAEPGVPAPSREGACTPDVLGVALDALAAAVRGGRVPKLALERIDGAPAIGSELAPRLVELGFQAGPRRLTLSA
jgi:ATP-dependent Lhr-like helicase